MSGSPRGPESRPSSLPRRIRRRGLRPRVDALEGRTLLSVTPIAQINAADVSPVEIVSTGASAYFVTRDPGGGASIRRTDGTAAGTSLVLAIPPQDGLDVTPESLTPAGSSLFYVTTDATNATLLERLDVGTGSVSTVATSRAVPVGSAIGNLTATATSLFFTSDAGTSLDAVDLASGSASVLASLTAIGDPANGPAILAVGGRILFSASTDASGALEPWASDGTAAGTAPIADVNPGAAGSDPQGFATLGGSAYLVAYDGTSDNLYRVDPGFSSLTEVLGGVSPQTPLVASGSSLAFVDAAAAGGPGLYRTLGGPGSEVAVYVPGAGGSGDVIGNLADLGGSLLFTATTPDGQTTLWKSVGAAGGAISLGPIVPGSGIAAGAGAPVMPVAVASGRAFFSAYDAARGVELWATDGTVAGTGPVADLDPGASGAMPQDVTAVGARVVFAGHDGSHFDALYASDGTAAGTSLLADFGSDAARGAIDPDAVPTAAYAATIGPVTYFAADDGDHGAEVWKTDGSASGTSLAADVIPGPSGSNPDDFLGFGGDLYFRAQSPTTGRYGLDRLDLVSGSITQVVSASTADVPSAPVVFKGRLAFVEVDYDGTGPSANPVQSSLRMSDGTPGGTVTIATFDPSLGQAVSGALVATPSHLFFEGDDADHGGELWASDGTAAGTGMVDDLAPGAESSGPSEVTAAGDVVYFQATDGQPGSELWKSDGSAAGTAKVADLGPLPGLFNPRDLTVAGGSLYFVNDDGVDGPQVWRTDLASGQTGAVALLGTSPASAGPSDLTAVGSRVIFRFDDVASSPQYYSTDGTAAGTVVINTDAIALSSIVTFGGSAYFAANDGGTSAFFVSDGTPAGTRVFTGIPDGFGLNAFLPLGATASGALVVLGDDATRGYQPYLVRDSSVSPVAYQPEMNYGLPDVPTEVVSGDFDGDGTPDLAVLEGRSGVVDLLLNRGDGSLAPPVAVIAEPGLSNLLAVDVDGDGKADLVGIVAGTSVAVFRNQGSSGFSAPQVVLSGDGFTDLASGDFNGDHAADLAVADPLGSAVFVLVGDGLGGFRSSAVARVGAQATRLALGDFDADGALDVAVTVPSGGSYAAEILRGDGAGGLATPVALPEVLASPEIASGRITGNAATDLVLLGGGGLVLVTSPGLPALRNDSAFGPAGQGSAPLVADLNRDGLDDVVAWPSAATGLGVLLSQGDGTFLDERDFGTSAAPSRVIAADLDRDGRNDLIAAQADGSVGVLLSGRSSPNAPPIFRPIAPQAVTIGQTGTFAATASDPNPGQALVFSLQGGNTATAAIDPATGVVTITTASGDPARVINLVIMATDDGSPALATTIAVPVTLVSPPPPNRKPSLGAISDQAVLAGDLLTFRATASDPDSGQVLTFSLVAPALAGASIDPASGVFSYTPDANVTGTFAATVTVTDDGDPALSDSANFLVVVTAPSSGNHAPHLDAIADQYVVPGATLTFSAHATDPDPGQAVTFALTAPGLSGATIDPASGRFTYSPAGNVTGAFPATITATDSGSPALSASVSFVVNVSSAPPPNRKPTLGLIPDQVVLAGSTLTFTATATDPDAGQSVTFSLSAPALAGATIDPVTGAFFYTPPAGFSGEFPATITATDSGSPRLSDAITFRVTIDAPPPPNRPPSLAAIPDQTATAGLPLSFVATASDPDPGQTLTFALGPDRPEGATIDARTGQVTWTPPASTPPGVVTFTISVTDDGSPALSDAGTVRVTVREPNAAPGLLAIADRRVDEGTAVVFVAVATDPDPGQHLRFSLDPGAPAGASIDPLTGAFAYTPAAGPADPVVTVRVTDDGSPSLSASSTFHVIVADVAPAVSAGPPATIVAGNSLVRSGSFTDPGAGPWSATVDYGDGSGVRPLVLGASASFALNHAYATAGAYPVTVTVVDPGGMAGVAMIPVAVVAAPSTPSPGVLALASATAEVSERAGTLTFAVIRSGGSDGAVSVAFATADGSARAGTDYAPVAGLLTFAAGETSRTISVTIRDSGGFSGAKSFSLALSSPTGGAGLGPVASAVATIRQDDPAPALVTIGPVGSVISSKKAGVTGIVLHVSGPLDAGSARNLAAYQLALVSKKGRKLVSKGIALKSAAYDAAAGTITLSPAKKLTITKALTLQVLGDALRDAYGRPVDGDHDGRAGGPAMASVSRSTVSVSRSRGRRS